MVSSQQPDGTQMVIVAIGFGAALARLLGGEIEDQPVPYTLSPLAEAALEDPRDHPW